MRWLRNFVSSIDEYSAMHTLFLLQLLNACPCFGYIKFAHQWRIINVNKKVIRMTRDHGCTFFIVGYSWIFLTNGCAHAGTSKIVVGCCQGTISFALYLIVRGRC
jgi:hypothetical protein